MNIQNPKEKEKILEVSMKRKETSTNKSVINQVNIKIFLPASMNAENNVFKILRAKLLRTYNSVF